MIWDRLLGEFVDVIEWTDPSTDTMVRRFERHGNEIKYGAQLTVRESQVAVFVNEGQIADVFKPGMYTLETANLPVLSTLQSWQHGFESPFKAEVYFVNTRQFTDLKWGTKHPVMLRDKEFGPVRLRAFGTYVVRINEPATFIKVVVGTDGHFTLEEITDQLRNLIVARFAAIIGEATMPVLDLAANYDDLGDYLTNRIRPEFQAYGLELTKLLVENVSLPDAVEQALDKRTSMGVIGDLKRYAQFQAAEAMAAAAANPSGGAGAGIGIGAGIALGQEIAAGLRAGGEAGAMPPPLPAGTAFHVAIGGQQQGPFALDRLQAMAAAGTLTPASLVWTQGMAAWQPASERPELAALFAAMPPPLPSSN